LRKVEPNPPLEKVEPKQLLEKVVQNGFALLFSKVEFLKVDF
jgi:hypothetical protein